ncbi:MAG: type I restriction enzyme HsdR N-terminal domain-containing protein [Reichenbachiella sp.]
MEKLALPTFNFKIRESNGQQQIWDDYRKKYIVITPEEWVRQHFLRYMEEYLNYPKSLMKVEGGLEYNRMKKRPDIVAFGNSGQPLVVVECKAPEIKIDQSVFEQASVYNKIIKAKYIIATNGVNHFCCVQNHETGTSSFMDEIPAYHDIL